MSDSDFLTTVERRAAAATDARVLREQVVASLRSVVPFDAYVFALTDPVTGVGSSPLADVPMLPWERLPDVIRARYGRRADFEAAFGEFGIQHFASGLGEDRFGSWVTLELMRTTEHFTEREQRLVSAVAGLVTPAIRQALCRTFRDQVPLPPLGAAVVVLDDRLRLRGLTESASAALWTLLPPNEDMAPIPAVAYNAGAALLSLEAGIRTQSAFTRVHLGGSRWITARAARMGADIAVSLEPSTPVERTDLLGRAAGLSPRETEVLGLVSIGLESAEIAEQLFVSEHTVKDHVKAILAKTGAGSRQVLRHRLAGND